MQRARIDQTNAEKRLSLLPNLSKALGNNWIAKEYRKPIDQCSLINGWISCFLTSEMSPF